MSHVTQTPLSRSKVRSPGRFAHCHVGTSGSCSGECGNVLAVGNCFYIAVGSARHFGDHVEGGAGHIVAAARLQLVVNIVIIIVIIIIILHQSIFLLHQKFTSFIPLCHLFLCLCF